MILAIYGAGGLGREIFDIAIRANAKAHRWEQIIFVDDVGVEGECFGTKRIKFESLIAMKSQCECVVGVGEPSSREKLFQKLKSEGFRMTTLVDPTAIVSPFAKMGEGSIICEFATLHTGVVLEENILIQPFCNIGHDIKVGSHSVLSSHCAPGGGILFGKRVYVGMQSTQKELITVGNDAIIGMGAVVHQNVAEKSVVVGNPARVTRGNDDHKVFSKK